MKIRIYLISTVHTEKGKCTSHNLFEILKKIKPDVVFGEASNEMYESFKKGLNTTSLELNAVEKLNEYHSFSFEPVDNETKLDSNQRFLFTSLIKKIEKDKYLKNVWKKNEENTFKYGFEYLNSNDNIEQFNRILKRLIYSILQLNVSEYKNILKKWLDHHDEREKNMLENINSYIKNNEIKSAILYCGSGHRKSLIDKIKENNDSRLNWIFELPK